MSKNVSIKRVYEEASSADGYRVLIDRLWPRGVSKEKAALNCWLKEIAPSAELRKWFNHEPEKWTGFREKYLEEIRNNPEPVAFLKERMKQGKLTLLYASKEQTYNDAAVLLHFLQNK